MTACDKPNWRAIAKGFTPALNAARTALAFPEGMPAGGLGFCGRGSWARAEVGFGSGFLRREASPSTAVRRRWNSVALRIWSDASRSDGKRGRARTCSSGRFRANRLIRRRTVEEVGRSIATIAGARYHRPEEVPRS